MKRITVLLILILALLFLGAEELKVYFADVGQGDGTVIITPSGKTVVLDCNSGHQSTIASILQENGHFGSIDYIVLSHYHSDHYGGLDDLIYGGYNVTGGCYDRGGTGVSSWVNAANSTSGKRKTAVIGEIIDFGDGVTMTFVHANGEVLGGASYPIAVDDENAHSLGVLIEYHNFDLYIGGDLTDPVEKILGTAMGDIDVYRVNHHGSSSSSDPIFLNAVSPEVSVISLASKYNHPHGEVLSDLDNVNSVIYQTEYNAEGSSLQNTLSRIANGNIFLTTDGCRYIINGGDLSEALYDCDVHCTHDVNPPLFDGLDAITDLGNGGELILSWDSASDTDNSTPITYNIYMSDSSGGQNFSATSYDTRNESYTVKSLVPGTEYFFVVRSEDYYENEDVNLIELSATPLSDIRPPVFSGLASASSNGNLGEIQLYWSAAADNSPPVSYRIYRALTSVAIDYVTPYAVVSGIGYTDTGLPIGQTYYYAVRAVDNIGLSDTNTVILSAAASGDTVAPEFNGLTAVFSTSNGGELLLTWQAADENSDTVSYSIYRSSYSMGQNFSSPLGTTTALKYYDRDLPWGEDYYYIVRAFDDSGNHDTNTVEKSGYVSYYIAETAPVEVFPNPAVTRKSFFVDWVNEINDIQILDISGVDHYSDRYLIERSSKGFEYDLRGLASGVYIILLKSRYETAWAKFAHIK